jgi:hypothetical protein
MRRFLNISTVFLPLLCIAVAAMWIRSCSIGDDLYYRGGSSVLWRMNSGDSRLIVSRFRGWPDAPSFHYRHYRFEATDMVTPVFVLAGHGLSRTDEHFLGISLTHGTVCLVVNQTGGVSWDSPAIPVLQSLSAAPVTSPVPFWEISIPWGGVLIAFSALPFTRLMGLILMTRRQHVRRRAGLCPCCGYDLRGSPARCPECGAACKAASLAGTSRPREIDDLPA